MITFSFVHPAALRHHTVLLLFSVVLFSQNLSGQVVEVLPVFPKVSDDVTVFYNAKEGNGALTGISPVYAHTGLITSASNNPNDWKHVQGVWGTADNHVLMQNLGNDRFSISYNIHDFYGVPDGEQVNSLAFVFRNANGSIVGRATDGADIYYPVYPDDVEFLSVLLAPQESALALFEGEKIPLKGATSQVADLYFYDNDVLLSSGHGELLEDTLEITVAGNHEVRFVAVRGTDTLEQIFYYTVIVNTIVEDPPAGYEDGITLLGDTAVFLQLHAPGKTYAHVIGDLTSWNPRAEYQMKRSVNGQKWWMKIDGLTPGETYRFQYLVDGNIRIGDPYSTLVLDPFNDAAIPSTVYPNLPPYPHGLTTGIVSCFSLNPPPSGQPLADKPAKADLILYELLLRDFLAAHSFDALTDTLDYLQRLGVNAIEIMPVQEFEGNTGWGYNPSYHMALDKYYGNAEAFSALIEACHARRMAVILDVVYNHAFGQSPLVQLYWDAANNRPAADNPWLNPVAKHDFNVGYDFNHESPATRYFVKRVLTWWMTAYGVDGFRFDLSKGFTQKNTLGNITAWGQYDQSRIDILQDYADHIWSMDPDAYVILEHFADNTEEKELSSRGMMLWGNMNSAYAQASMGYGGSDLSNIWYVQRGWTEPNLVGYMESHDEERIMYKNLTSGNTAPNYSIKDLNTALGRIELVSTFFYLMPGPKMCWAFGELGFDYSINYCTDGSINNNCRLDPKPIRWDYYDVLLRRRIYDIDRALIALRAQQAWKEGEFSVSLANQFEKKIAIRHPDMDIVIAGNFFVGERSIAPGFTRTGQWYDYLAQDSIEINTMDTSILYTPGEYHIYTTSRIDPGFDITTAIHDAGLVSTPLVIRPTLHSGECEVLLPDDVTADVVPEVYTIDGRQIRSDFIVDGNAFRLSIGDAPSGLYVLRIKAGNRIYVGKMIKQ